MKTLIRNSDNLSIYSQDDLVLTVDRTKGDGWYDLNHTSMNSIILDLNRPPLWEGAIWSYANGEWVVVDHDRYELLLATARDKKWLSIQEERDLRQASGIKVGSHWFKSTEKAQNEYNSMILLSIGLPADKVLQTNWRTLSDTTVDMTSGLVREILLAGFAHFALVDNISQAHKTKLYLSNDPANYDFSANWPETYVEPLSKKE